MFPSSRLMVITERDLAVVNPARLPPMLRKLVRLIGLSETLRLTCRFGGARVSLGVTRQPKTKLRKALSEASIEVLAKHLDHEHIDIPTPDSILAQIRDASIQEQASRGATLAELSEDFGLTRRHIMNICAQKKGKGK